jgi:molybdenum cofactor biosynthesis protein B
MSAVRRPVRVAVLTISDSRTLETDTSGAYLVESIETAGHTLAGRTIVPDDAPEISACLQGWIADPAVEVVVSTGGTGITGRDGTPEVVSELVTKEIPGFGELFRWLSFEEIGASTIQSRALAGLARTTLIFALPGSTNACRLAWTRILSPQLDIDTRPCNFVELLPRLEE